MFGLAIALSMAAGQATDVSTQADRDLGRRDAVIGAIEYQTFMALPREHQRLIIGRVEDGSLSPEQMASMPDWLLERQAPEAQDQILNSGEPGDYSVVSSLISREAFEAMPRFHQRALVGVYQKTIETGHPVASLCFAPGTPMEVVNAFNLASIGGGGIDFEPGTRWSNTASGSFPGAGNPAVLTWSIVPDGTLVPDAVGIGAQGPSSLQA